MDRYQIEEEVLKWTNDPSNQREISYHGKRVLLPSNRYRYPNFGCIPDSKCIACHYSTGGWWHGSTTRRIVEFSHELIDATVASICRYLEIH